MNTTMIPLAVPTTPSRAQQPRPPAAELPAYAFPYAHPAATKGDVGASFYEDDGHGTICVSIEQLECGQVQLCTHRGGLSESCFTRNELARVLELAGILFAANGKQPARGK